MRTLYRSLALPVVVAALLAGCGDDSDTTGTTDGRPTSTEATTSTSGPSSTAVTTTAPPSTLSPIATAVSVPMGTGPGITTEPTLPDGSGDQPVSGDAIEIIVHVGVDDAATLGERVEQVPVGSDVVLRLFSEQAEQYHVHGVDLERDVPAGVEAVFEFTPPAPGRYEVETHRGDTLLLVIEVV